MLEGGDASPFGAVVGILRAYLGNRRTRLLVDARLGRHAATGPAADGRVGHGASLRLILAVTYEVLSENRSDEQLDELHESLGLLDDDDDRTGDAEGYGEGRSSVEVAMIASLGDLG